MNSQRIRKQCLASALITLALGACGTMQTVRSFSTKYEQPTSGERARIRVVSDGMIRVVPNSACVDWRLPGAGVMIVQRKGFAQVNKLDMPIGDVSVQKAVESGWALSELYIPAGRPIVLDYLSPGQLIGGSQYQCSAPRSFVPAAGGNYEAVYLQQGSLCRFSLVRLIEGGVDQTATVLLTEAKLCHALDNF